MKIVGMFRRRAAISIPGMILSQLGIITRASKGWAMAMASTESAISSRLAREYFIPVCPMAMPSQIPMAGNSTGVPPAMRMPALTSSAMIRRWIWPGMISLAELTTPIKGRPISSSVYPMALNRERWGARSRPFFIKSLRMSPSLYLIYFFRRSGRRARRVAPACHISLFLMTSSSACNFSR